MFEEDDYDFWMVKRLTTLATRMPKNDTSLQDIRTHQNVRFTRVSSQPTAKRAGTSREHKTEPWCGAIGVFCSEPLSPNPLC